jgi:hypothetical protein
MIRSAISPRFAIRIFENIKGFRGQGSGFRKKALDKEAGFSDRAG